MKHLSLGRCLVVLLILCDAGDGDGDGGVHCELRLDPVLP